MNIQKWLYQVLPLSFFKRGALRRCKKLMAKVKHGLDPNNQVLLSELYRPLYDLIQSLPNDIPLSEYALRKYYINSKAPSTMTLLRAVQHRHLMEPGWLQSPNGGISAQSTDYPLYTWWSNNEVAQSFLFEMKSLLKQGMVVARYQRETLPVGELPEAEGIKDEMWEFFRSYAIRCLVLETVELVDLLITAQLEETYA